MLANEDISEEEMFAIKQITLQPLSCEFSRRMWPLFTYGITQPVTVDGL